MGLWIFLMCVVAFLSGTPLLWIWWQNRGIRKRSETLPIQFQGRPIPDTTIRPPIAPSEPRSEGWSPSSLLVSPPKDKDRE